MVKDNNNESTSTSSTSSTSSNNTKQELKSPYEILGIEKTDNPVEIKQAYKILALKYHPDKNPHGVDKFQEINRAYQILSNPDTKLFYDSFGYDGLMFNQFGEAVDSKGSEWLISISFTLISLIIDHFFSIYIEWIFVSMFILYFLFLSRSQLEILFFIYVGGANLLLYFILPSKVLPFITNFIIYGIVFLWPNIRKKNSSITVTLWFFVMFFDSLRDIDINSSYSLFWRILSVNIIIFGSIILLLLGIYVLKKPETGPSFYSSILALIFTSLNNSELDISIYLIFWCPIWFLDFLSGRRIEWLIPPAFSIVKLILLQSSPIKIAAPLILSATGVYYFIPQRIYQFLSNYIIHFLFHMVIYKANVALINNKDNLDQDQKSKLLIEKSVKQLLTGFIFLVIQYFLNFSTGEWLFLGSLSLGYSLLIMAELYFFSFSLEQSNDNNAIQPYNNNNDFNFNNNINFNNNFNNNNNSNNNNINNNFNNNNFNSNNNNAFNSFNSFSNSFSNNSFSNNFNNSFNSSFNNSFNNNNNNSSNNSYFDHFNNDFINNTNNFLNNLNNSKFKLNKNNNINNNSNINNGGSGSGSSALIKACQTCFKKNVPLKRCSKCKTVYYCSKECQIRNWNFHKNICLNINNNGNNNNNNNNNNNIKNDNSENNEIENN